MSTETSDAAPLAHADFAPYQGQPFRVDSFAASLVLAAIRQTTTAGWPVHLRQPFTLIFHGPRRPLLEEALHQAEAPDGRRFGLYIMPVHSLAVDRQEYQAVFN